MLHQVLEVLLEVQQIVILLEEGDSLLVEEVAVASEVALEEVAVNN